MPVEENGTRGLSQRDLILEVRSDVKKLHETVMLLHAKDAEHQAVREDHEDRLRGLERWKYALPPTFIIATLSAVATFIELGKV